MTTTDSPWVDGLSYPQVLARTVQQFSGHDALIFPQLGYRQNYGEFLQEVHVAARALLALGVQHGEHVGIWATNWPQWVVIQFASAGIGAVLVNINPAYRAHELAYVLNQADITTLLLTDQFKTSNYFDILAAVCPELSASLPGELHAAACPRLRHVISIKPAKRPGMIAWDEFRGLAARIDDAVRMRRAD